MTPTLQLVQTSAPGQETSGPTGLPSAAPAACPVFLSKNEIARGYQQAFFLLRDLAATQAHLLSREGWERLVEATSYCGWRYNAITLEGTEFAPGPWKGSAR